MTDYSMLLELVLQKLERDGTLTRLRADLKSSIYQALKGEKSCDRKLDSSRRLIQEYLQTDDGRILTSLVREFMQFFGMQFTLAVFDSEIDTKKGILSRFQLCQEFQLPYRSDDLPVLARLMKTVPSTEPTVKPLEELNYTKRLQEFSNRSSPKQQRKSLPERERTYEEDTYETGPPEYETSSRTKLRRSNKFSSKDRDSSRFNYHDHYDIFDKEVEGGDYSDEPNCPVSDPVLSMHNKQIEHQEDKHFRNDRHKSRLQNIMEKNIRYIRNDSRTKTDQVISCKDEISKRRISKSNSSEEFIRRDFEDCSKGPIRGMQHAHSHSSVIDDVPKGQDSYYRQYHSSENKILKTAFNGLLKEQDEKPSSRKMYKEYLLSPGSKTPRKHFERWNRTK